MLACRALRQRLTAELDQLNKALAPRRMQRQPSTAALARRRSAALGIVPPPVAAATNGEAAAGSSRINLSAVSACNPADPPLRSRAAIASFKVGSGRLSSGRLAQAPRTAAIEPHPVAPAWTALLPPPQQQQQRPPQPAIQPAVVLSTTPRPSPFAAAAAVPAPDVEASEQVTSVVEPAFDLTSACRARHHFACVPVAPKQRSAMLGCTDRSPVTFQDLPLDQDFVVQLSVRFQDADPGSSSAGGAVSSPRQPQTPPLPHRVSIKRARSLLGRMRGSMDLLLGDGDGR